MEERRENQLEQVSVRETNLFHISEALSACGKSEQLARVLGDQLRGLISFDPLDVLILKENSSEIEWHGWGTAPAPFHDLPGEESANG